MKESSNDFVKMLFIKRGERMIGKRRSVGAVKDPNTIGFKFKNQLLTLYKGELFCFHFILIIPHLLIKLLTILSIFHNLPPILPSQSPQIIDILATTPHYVRCVKPNTIQAPSTFNPTQVFEQLKCNGTLEIIRIRREGYPIRETWSVLWDSVVGPNEYAKWSRKARKWKGKEKERGELLSKEERVKDIFDEALEKGGYQVATMTTGKPIDVCSSVLELI
jgi:hypothetical protein